MKNTKTIKYRLILSLSAHDVAYERLFNEFLTIEKNSSDEIALANKAKRKHLLKILFNHCNPTIVLSQNIGLSSSPQTEIWRTESIASTSRPTHQPNTTTPLKESEFEHSPLDGVLQEDGSRKFGDLILKIETK